jgi:endoribonuclease LACTB2
MVPNHPPNTKPGPPARAGSGLSCQPMRTASPTPGAETVDAVTAAILFEGELLLTRRHPGLPAFPGYHAFPGGKVDAEDEDGPPLPASELPAWNQEPPRLLRALARELQEELGLDLPDLVARGAVAALQPLGTALTPPFSARRFNTHFYRIDLHERPEIIPDARETAEADWATPARWLADYEAGRLLCAPPTLATLRALAANLGSSSVPGLSFEYREQAELPMVESLRGVRQIWVRSHTLPPAQHTNAFLLGDFPAHRVLVDPSPSSEAELDRLCAFLERTGFHEIFLTHHHPDHHERADAIARRFQVPMGMSADTQNRIYQKNPGFFEGVSYHLYEEGDVLCRWLGEPVRILAVPGHDAGQLALMPDSRAWCLVGDLIQGIGTVVIAAPEGDMRAYFQSLEKIIALNPRVIYPSHGGALGTVFRLQETLRHRQLREQQILALHRAGKQPEEMLPTVYAGVNPALWPLARMNIDSHLRKLEAEGQLTTN